MERDEGPPGPPPASHRRRWRPTKRISFGGGALALIIVLIVIFLLGRGGGASRSGRAEVVLERAASTGADPFTPDVATSPKAARAGRRSDVKRAATGDLVGLFGGIRDRSSCDTGRIVAFFTENPAQGQAWADVERITYPELPAYLSRLTSVLLRTDTRVTDYGYHDGRSTPRHAVLEAGTAVLVDGFGVPRARCAGGSPLNPALGLRSPVYKGSRWGAFNPANVIIVNPARSLARFVLIDVSTNALFVRPAGSNGTRDEDFTPPPAPPAPPPPTTTRPPVTTRPRR